MPLEGSCFFIFVLCIIYFDVCFFWDVFCKDSVENAVFFKGELTGQLRYDRYRDFVCWRCPTYTTFIACLFMLLAQAPKYS